MSGIKEGERNTALVTGSGRGIGRGIAAALAERGWTVAVHYRANRDTAEETLEEVRRRGGDGFTVSADISDLDQHEALVEKVLEKRGGIDLFVNNAGIAPRTRKDMLEMTPESFDEVMGTNLRGPVFLTQRVANEMIRRLDSGKEDRPMIITITSISAAAVVPEGRANPRQLMLDYSTAGDIEALRECLVRAHKAEFGSSADVMVGLQLTHSGRMVLSYPRLPADVLSGRPLDRKRICRTFSECTTAPRKGLVSGCYALDEFYRSRAEKP